MVFWVGIDCQIGDCLGDCPESTRTKRNFYITGDDFSFVILCFEFPRKISHRLHNLGGDIFMYDQ